MDAAVPDAPALEGGGTSCADIARWIYLVATRVEGEDRTSFLLRFEPDTVTLTEVGPLNCPTDALRYSMAVDRTGSAWVLFDDGELFRVSLEDASCEATSYVPNQMGLRLFGMGFAADGENATTDTLYIAGGAGVGGGAAGASTFGTLSLPGFVVETRGAIDGWPELTGNALGELWGFRPNVAPKTVIQLDKSSGEVLQSFDVDAIDTKGSGTVVLSWAFAFWGGEYYMFYRGALDASTAIWKLSPAGGADAATVTPVLTSTAYSVAGAGVSTCAPVIIL